MRVYGRLEYVVHNKLIWQNLKATPTIRQMARQIAEWYEWLHPEGQKTFQYKIMIKEPNQPIKEMTGKINDDLY